MRLPTEASVASSSQPQSQSGKRSLVAHGTDAIHRAARALLERTLSRRDDCQGSASACEKPSSDNNVETIAIVLVTVIPLALALAVILYLHRRVQRKQRVEDANDPHRSLDFGVGLPVGAPSSRQGRKGGPEMIITEHDQMPGHDRGLSMDMLGSPYMLPNGINNSRESFQRSVQDEHDPYRPVTWARQSEDSKRSPRLRAENGSIYSANESASLVAHARPMSQSYPLPSGPIGSAESEYDGAPLGRMASNPDSSIPARKPLPNQPAILTSGSPSSSPLKDSESVNEISFPVPTLSEADNSNALPPRTSSNRKEPPANIEIPPLPTLDRQISQSSVYEEDRVAVQTGTPEIMEPVAGEDEGYDIDPSLIQTGRFSIDGTAPSQQYPAPAPADHRVSVMGLRPLPNDNPEENAEQRANRIRSFYREYFDDSKPNPGGGYYEDDYDNDFLDGAVYDPETGGYFIAGARPFAQEPGRRAMTPPAGGARPGDPGVHGRAYSTMSAGRRPGGGRPGPAAPPKKKLPPPKPLQSLPTPHMMKDDSMMVLTPIDFAPASTFRDTQNGRRADSPLGTPRPFSPNVRAYSPLVPASNELSVMPSPHHLRKSGTFTGLDFARLPRFRGQEGNASDTGSIRSARSGISAMQVDAVRAGAYRVSRIPKEMVTTRDDLATQLRPQMNLTRPA